jgi:RNA polymerase sigma factor (TIGR02999 family)
MPATPVRDPSIDITELLAAWREGDARATEELFRCIYPQLKRIAARELTKTRANASLSASELVNELYLKLDSRQRLSFESRTQFFAFTARLLRDVLVDYFRRKHRLKRGSGTVLIHLGDGSLTLDEDTPAVADEILALDEALVGLASVSQVAVRVVELRYFGGLTIEETANALGIGSASVVRSWRYARAWLRRALDEAPRREL